MSSTYFNFRTVQHFNDYKFNNLKVFLNYYYYFSVHYSIFLGHFTFGFAFKDLKFYNY